MAWLEGEGEESPLNVREQTIARQILKEIQSRLKFLKDVGLDYLTLDRTASTLSGGEAQRIRLATQIGSGLMGVLYVCDEPSVGLHPVDDHLLIDTLKRLRDLGNTVIIVEHDEAIMRSADHIIDLGPGAGEHGGHVVATGTVEEVSEHPDSITGQYLSSRKKIPLPEERRTGNGGELVVKGARENNLKDVDLSIPMGMLVCITGVSGSGKSSLIYEVLYKRLAQMLYGARDKPGECDAVHGIENIDKVVNIDQSPIGRTPRSNPATYTGAFTPIRELFAAVPEARVRGYAPGRFSFNVKGGPVRGVRRRRLHSDRDAVPPKCHNALRGVPGSAIQPGGPGDNPQRQEHLRSAGHDGLRGIGVLLELPAGCAPSWRPCGTWAWGTYAWGSRQRPSAAARPSG